jgi:hypothetical protein
VEGTQQQERGRKNREDRETPANQPASALHGNDSAEPKPLSLPAHLRSEMTGEAEKLLPAEKAAPACNLLGTVN